LRPAFAPDRWPLLTFVAALATGDALLEASEVITDIKWPNDLLANERKICGILAEGIETPAGRAVIVGIGINLTDDAFPSELASVATSVASEGRRPERETILAALLKALARWYALLHERDGAEKIVAAWVSRSSYAEGKLVQVTNGDEVVQGVTCGVESDGALRLRTTGGGLQLIRAGDVTSVRPARVNA
jgi:BirA family biotin operon repressor/biotin-[acetyl-CoA-carboxylase] ligase